MLSGGGQVITSMPQHRSGVYPAADNLNSHCDPINEDREKMSHKSPPPSQSETFETLS